MVIQRMNNVLVKHSKVLFGFITIVIVVSFVWFLTPGADGSLFFNRNSGKAGQVFGEKLTIQNLRDARKDILLSQIVWLYAQNPEFAGNIRSDISEDQAFAFAAILKAAKKFGYDVSDNELKSEIGRHPAFQKDGNFSPEAYEKFKQTCLKPRGFRLEDFENAIRNNLIYEKIRNASGGLVTVTDDELDLALEDLFRKVTFRIVTFLPNSFAKGLQTTKAELQAHYDAAKEKYQTLPESDALVVFINADSCKTPEITQAQVEEHYKKFSSMYKGKDGKDLPLAAATAQIKNDLAAAARRQEAGRKTGAFYSQMLDLVKTEEFKKDPAGTLRSAAEKAGFSAAFLQALTTGSPATPSASAALIAKICALRDTGTFTEPAPEKDSFAFAMLTARRPAKQLSFQEAGKQLEKDLLQIKAERKAREAARNFRAKCVTGKITADAVEKTAKPFGGIVSKPETKTKWEVFLQKKGLFEMAQYLIQQAPTREAQENISKNIKGRIMTLIEQEQVLGLPEASLSEPHEYEIVFVEKCVPASQKEKADMRKQVLTFLSEEKMIAERELAWLWLTSHIQQLRNGKKRR